MLGLLVHKGHWPYAINTIFSARHCTLSIQQIKPMHLSDLKFITKCHELQIIIGFLLSPPLTFASMVDTPISDYPPINK